MSGAEFAVILWGAAVIAGVHTLSGAAHYLPIVAVSIEKRWSASRSALVAVGIGGVHVVGSAVVGVIGIVMHRQLEDLMPFDQARGEIAAWLMVGIGLMCLLAHLRRRLTRHSIAAASEAASVSHGYASGRLLPWSMLFVIAMAPCEPLIPFMLYPGLVNAPWALIAVLLCFALVTIGVICAATLLCRVGLLRIGSSHLERNHGLIAGTTLLSCGAAIIVLGA